jgi:hypothetical protein
MDFAEPELLVIAGTIILATAIILALVLARAARQPPPAALITALSMLTLFAIGAATATQSGEAWAVAAAGMGALASSTTSLFNRPEPTTQVEKAVAVVQELERREQENGDDDA